MYCPSCGKANPDDSKFCESCGSKMNGQTASSPPPQQSYSPPPPQQSYSPPQQQSYSPPPPQQNYAPSAPPSYNMANLDAPLTVGNFIVMFLLSSVTCGIALLIWAFGSNVNKNKQNYARAALIMALVGIGLSIIFSVLAGGLIAALFSGGSYYNGW